MDAGGNLLAFARVEGAAVLARDPAIAKAATSASIGAATGGIPFEFARTWDLRVTVALLISAEVFQSSFGVNWSERSASDPGRLNRMSASPKPDVMRYWRRWPPPRDDRRRRVLTYLEIGMTNLYRIAKIACLTVLVGSATAALAGNQKGTGMTSKASSASDSAKHLASDRPIGKIEPVFEFYDAMPTGVSVAADGRIFINIPRWGDDVPFTVGEIRNGKVVPYPDATINRFDPKRPEKRSAACRASSSMRPTGSGFSIRRRRAFRRPWWAARSWSRWTLTTNKVVKTIVLPPSTCCRQPISTMCASTCVRARPALLHHRFVGQRTGRHHRC